MRLDGMGRNKTFLLHGGARLGKVVLFISVVVRGQPPPGLSMSVCLPVYVFNLQTDRQTARDPKGVGG